MFNHKNKRYKPLQISYTRLTDAHNTRRFWQEGLRLEAAGFAPGTSISITSVPEVGTLVIEPDEGGSNTVSSRKRRGSETQTPIIDINNRSLEDAFGEMRQLRVSYFKDKLVAQVHSHEMNRFVAMDDYESNLQNSVLTMGSVCVGGGICSSAIKDGADTQGLRIDSEWVIDIENKYLQNVLDNTAVANDKTMLVEGALGDVEVDQLTPVNVLNVSMPCTGFSPSGRAKNRLENPESHKTAGTAILKVMEIIEKLMPPVIVNENVVPFASSASADLMAGRLKELGYNVQSKVFGNEMGTLENRQRSIMVATHPSLDLNMDNIVPVMTKEEKIGDILEDLPLDDPSWKSYSYLADKEKRDIAAGKGFRRQLLNGSESECGVIGRGYMKARSTEPFIQHPLNSELSRLLTVKEHAGVMKIPPELVANLSDTVAHEILGQSGSYALFNALGQWLVKDSRTAKDISEVQAEAAEQSFPGMAEIVDFFSHVHRQLQTVEPEIEEELRASM